ARAGFSTGASVMRMVGPAAGRKPIAVVNGVIAAPGQGRVRNRVGDQLLFGLAATGYPDGVKYELDLARMDRGDPTLASRAVPALSRACGAPDGFEPADRGALVPSLPALVTIARDDRMSGRPANDAVALIQAVGPPQCLAPLMGMLAAPHPDSRFKFV